MSAIIKCPNCGHEFDGDETFAWIADDDGDPTVEYQSCPKCGIATQPIFNCSFCPNRIHCKLEETCGACLSTDFDSFKIVRR